MPARLDELLKSYDLVMDQDTTLPAPAYKKRTPKAGWSLEALTAVAGRLSAVTKADLRWGDRVIVTTKNSVYSLFAVEDGTYWVTGGWFDRHSCSPQRVWVNGCTFGGSAIMTDVVAAPGLFLEFHNRVTTTRIRETRVVRGDPRPVYH